MQQYLERIKKDREEAKLQHERKEEFRKSLYGNDPEVKFENPFETIAIAESGNTLGREESFNFTELPLLNSKTYSK